ncbi:hypothetical protein F4778DRAFT_785422 [Xylariomycetidae sp. FL2044]|nr:hypothetical protein F4778DRAFT_785422 [Xylariomycetidae sp. FL2044]
MASIFREMEAEELYEDEKVMFDVLKATLNYPSKPEILARKLADDIIFFCMLAREDEGYRAILSIAWNLIFDMISYILPDHKWQDVWAHALEIFSGRGGLPPRNGKPELSWKDLPEFSEQQRESYDKIESDDEIRWKSLSSFYARIYASRLMLVPQYPMWVLRATVEELDSSADVPEAGLWVATEWLIRGADNLLELMITEDAEDDMEKRVFRLGSMLADKEGVGLLSIERWDFWKEWFSSRREKLADGGEEANAVTIARISETLDKMKEAEEKSKRDAPT